MLSWLRKAAVGKQVPSVSGSGKRSDPSALQERIDQLEEELRRLKTAGERRPSGPHYEIHVANVNIDKPAVERLLFRLDRLDIDDLSGSLNLGNNFMGTGDGELDDPAKRKKPGAETGNPASADVASTKMGYSVKFPSK